MVDFGNRIKTLRQKNSLTQEQLAQRLNMTKSVISAYENGVRMPSYDVLISLARIFRVSTDYLLGLENKNLLDISGLTPGEATALRNLVHAMSQR